MALMENLISVRKQLRERFGKDHLWLTDATALPSMEQAFLSKVRQAVETHLDNEQYGAEQLGGDVGLSRTQLHRKLKEIIGQSPGGLIRTIRLQRALELLQQRVATVAEVAYMVGFSNPANFSTSFSRHFGYPPSQVTQKKALNPFIATVSNVSATVANAMGRRCFYFCMDGNSNPNKKMDI